MAIIYKIWDFPELPIQEQLFHSPGEAYEGGFTVGGARMFSPEPGGRAVVELRLAMQVNEWDNPLSSWLMSKINGQIFKYRLYPTPQLAVRSIIGQSIGVPWDNLQPWDNKQNWDNSDVFCVATQIKLEGSVEIICSVEGVGQVLKPGHVIGHKLHSYLIDEIRYNDLIATITVTPPLRKDVAVSDLILLRPYFLGTISNGAEIRETYRAENVGHIQPGRIILNEVVI